MQRLANIFFASLILIFISSCCDCYKKQTPPASFERGELQVIPGHFDNANDARDAMPVQKK